MCMFLRVCMQKTINALWVPIAQHALKRHLIQLEDYIAPLRLNAKKQRGTKIPFVKRWQSRLKRWEGQRGLHGGRESASIDVCCTIVQSLVSQSAAPLCQHKHGQNIAPRFSHGPGLLTSILSVPHCDAEVLIHVICRRAWALLYKCWQIVVLCQARVCASTRARSYGWGATWAHIVIKPGACVLSKCQFTPAMSTSERARSACSWNHSTSSN